MKHLLTQAEVDNAAGNAALALVDLAESLGRVVNVYPVPRGGIPALYLIAFHFAYLTQRRIQIVDKPEIADVIVDDLIDGGGTRERMIALQPFAKFICLFDKRPIPPPDRQWLVFPWEQTEEKSIEETFVRLIQFCGENPERGGLQETPERMAKAWSFWTSGYEQHAKDILKTFEDGGELYDEMIHVERVPFYSQCEHHLAPFFGEVAFAYVPDRRIVGLSKMSRLVNVFARRLQVQERLTVQIVDAFCEVMAPKGAGCIISARHLCMESRGICQQGIITTTSALRGVFKEPSVRAEFLSLSHR